MREGKHVAFFNSCGERERDKCRWY